jgi:membrane complex biogenesis BtpA family protein
MGAMPSCTDLLGFGPFVGMVHLRPLPGSPDGGDLAAVEEAALADARALAKGGADALALENFGDAPFFPDGVPAITVASMTRVARRLRDAVDLPLGINVLRNDAIAALSIAVAVEAAFIRVNVLTGARVADQGILQGRAHELLRLRRELGASSIRILADVDVKHSAPLSTMPLEQEVADTLRRGRADAVIVSGTGTGGAIDPESLRRVRRAADGSPVLAGSGVTPDAVASLAEHVDGYIVGTWLKRDGRVDRPVEIDRVRRLAAAIVEHGTGAGRSATADA